MTTPSPTHSDSSGSSKHDSNHDSWEIVEGLRGVPASMQEPDRQEGFLLKRRKWPMKGWHKRYFVLEKGILKYAKRGSDVGIASSAAIAPAFQGANEVFCPQLKKGKLHGCIDVGLSVMSIKKKAMCIDLDTEDNIYHLKARPHSFIYNPTRVKSPELFEEWVTKLRHHRVFRQNEIATYPHERHLFNPHASASPSLNETLRKRATLTKQASVHQAKVSSWLHSSEDMNKCCKDLEECESYLLELNLLLKSMEVLHRTYSAPAISALQVPSCISSQSPRLHASNPNLSTTDSNAQEVSTESPDSPTDGSRLQEDFSMLANNIHSTLKSAFSSLVAERDRLRLAIDRQAPQPAQVMGLKTAYASECPGGSHSLVHQVSNESKASIPESISEFFDAQEYLLSSSSSENEVSDDDSYIISSALTVPRRRSTLPSPSPTSSVSLWNILKNNIGKDLSKVAMPVQLNEPLNTLQRLCEELEYSELLDTANSTQDPYQRMVYVATFAISAYASTYHRAGSKPFNPVLGETYECDRPDKSFRFIAEQELQLLARFGDHYEWNKVTSCIHNILSGQRWIEHYGEMSIKNINGDACQCKVTFVKARSWSSTVNEIEGVVTDSNGKVVHTIFGKWQESVFQGDPPSATCIWRANPMPVDQDQFYGFTQFAVELNELDSTLRSLLTPTDTRFRPDQRLSL
ncbi:Oxysterol-binding protein-related protein 3 [Liparis tanakae]|uniref:Oxysterol-binding protein-related protein 3 n=1 Tax=Liparis tanakae TaxID=230148 RepID=A0A4Z2JDL1_9TELE|nr:Oxysterol-binding protein-related protein 3 [Liparis tanakae]